MGEKIRGHIRSNVIGCVALFALIVVPVALAATDGGPQATASGVKQKVKKLTQQVQQLQQQLDALATQPGPQGPGGPQGPEGPAGLQGPVGPSTGPAGGDLTGNYPNPDIAADAVGTNEVGPNALTGGDINESTLGQVPQASNAGSATNAQIAATAVVANNLNYQGAYVKSNSVVVPGGSQAESNGNGFSRAVTATCNVQNGINPDLAMGGGAFWSGNTNSNSDELENRIHSAAFLDTSGDVATSGEVPFAYRARGEVDKDGDDTLTVQVVCYPAF